MQHTNTTHRLGSPLFFSFPPHPTHFLVSPPLFFLQEKKNPQKRKKIFFCAEGASGRYHLRGPLAKTKEQRVPGSRVLNAFREGKRKALQSWGGLVGLIQVNGNKDEYFLKGESGPVVILGQEYNHPADPRFRTDLKNVTWFCYRKNFTLKTPNGRIITSDAGWGCVHRCGQMLLCTTLAVHLRRERSFMVSYFMDSSVAPFSIQRICNEGVKHGRRIGQWFAPSTIAKCLDTLVTSENNSTSSPLSVEKLSVVVCEQAAIYPDKLHHEIASHTGILLLVPIRLGLDRVDSEYYSAIKGCLSTPATVGIIGGKPKYSLYFTGFQGDQLIYTDPHKVQSAFLTTDSLGSTVDPHRQSVPISEIDPSCLLCFYLSAPSEIDELVDQLKLLMQKYKYPILSFVSGYPSMSDIDGVDTDCNASLDDDDDYIVI